MDVKVIVCQLFMYGCFDLCKGQEVIIFEVVVVELECVLLVKCVVSEFVVLVVFVKGGIVFVCIGCVKKELLLVVGFQFVVQVDDVKLVVF